MNKTFEDKMCDIILVLLALLLLFANIVLAYAVFNPSVFSRTYNVFIDKDGTRAVVEEH